MGSARDSVGIIMRTSPYCKKYPACTRVALERRMRRLARVNKRREAPPRDDLKPRLCRNITPSGPSFEAQQAFYKRQLEARDNLELHGATETVGIATQPPRAPALEVVKSWSISMSRFANESQYQLAIALSHLKDLKIHSHAVIFELPHFLSIGPDTCARNTLRSLQSDHANAVAYSSRAKKSMSSSQQVTRYAISAVGTCELAQQLTNAVVLGFAVADTSSSPEATSAISGNALFNGPPKHFLMTSFREDVLSTLPRSLTPYSLIDRVKTIARLELDDLRLSVLVPQSTLHIRTTCASILTPNEDGVTLWSVVALLLYLASNYQFFSLLDECGITEFDIALASALFKYAHGLVGNRSRRSLLSVDDQMVAQLKELQRQNHVSVGTVWSGAAAEEDESDDDDEASEASGSGAGLTEIAAATRLQRTCELGRKARKLLTEDIDEATTVRITKKPLLSPKYPAEFVCLSVAQKDGFLAHLHADSPQASRLAAHRVLEWQLSGLDCNIANPLVANMNLPQVSSECAERSQRAMETLISQTQRRSPAVVGWKHTNGQCSVGIARNVDADHLLMACRLSPLQPSERSATKIAWVDVTCTTCRAAHGSPHTGLCELECEIAELETKTTKSNAKQIDAFKHRLPTLRGRCFSKRENGVTRTVLAFKAKLPVVTEVLQAAKHIAARLEEAKSLPPQVTRLDLAAPDSSVSNVFTVGMLLYECARTEWGAVPSKQSCSVVPLAPDQLDRVDGRVAYEKHVNPKHRPWCILNVLDLKFEQQMPVADTHHNPRRVHEVDATATVTVGGDGAVAVPTFLDLLLQPIRQRTTTRPEDILSLVRQFLSVLCMSGVQVASFEQFANATSHREINQKVECTSKIESPDNHYRAFLTLHQAFAVCHNKLPTMFEESAYADTFGCGYDCGAIAACNLAGRAVVSDRRSAAFCKMSSEQVDELTAEFGARSFVQTSATSYVKVPMADLGGLPRYLFVGVHSALRGLEAAFRALKRVAGESHRNGRQSIQVLPFGPFSQAVRPPCSTSSSETRRDFREVVRGPLEGVQSSHASFGERTISTLVDYSILNSPIMQSVSVKMLDPTSENVFETIEPVLESVVLIASMIVELAKGLHSTFPCTNDEFETLRHHCLAFHGAGVEYTPVAVFSAYAVVLFNSWFPLDFEVGELVLLDGYARAPNNCLTKGMRKIEDVQCIRFARRLFDDTINGPWAAIKCFLVKIRDHGCKFDNSKVELKSCADALAALAPALWRLHSEDGVTPPGAWSPLSCRSKPEHVLGADLICVWVDRPNSSEKNRRRQRGALMGLSFATQQQIFSLLAGAFLDSVVVNAARNEGNMSLRISSCAVKEAESGRLTAKSTSPIYSDSDAAAFGSLRAKEVQSQRQIAAWEQNNQLIFQIASQFGFPNQEKFEGCIESLSNVKALAQEWAVLNHISNQELKATRTMRLCMVEGV